MLVGDVFLLLAFDPFELELIGGFGCSRYALVDVSLEDILYTLVKGLLRFSNLPAILFTVSGRSEYYKAP